MAPWPALFDPASPGTFIDRRLPLGQAKGRALPLSAGRITTLPQLADAIGLHVLLSRAA